MLSRNREPARRVERGRSDAMHLGFTCMNTLDDPARRWCTNRQPEEIRRQRFLDLRVK
jgi:hypothetical protein